MRWAVVAAVAAAPLPLTACGSDDDVDETDDGGVIDDGIVPPPPEVDGTAWEFVVGGGPGGDVVLVDGFPITIAFEGDQLSGTAACNSYGATYRLDGIELVIDGLAQTEIGCEPDVMASELAYLTALASVTELTISGGAMVLGSVDTELSFAPLTESG